MNSGSGTKITGWSHGVLGFDDTENPRFLPGEGRRPGASKKTIIQILESLPQDYLAYAPHALTENGIASGKTATGDLRWKALHHERLNAVDPGSTIDEKSESFNSKFRRRELSDFPCLKHIAFISSSDAYCIEDLGNRFSWIRMCDPSLEALRQAFLDHDARIICDIDPRLSQYQDKCPNNIQHSWIETVNVGGDLGNSKAPFRITLHPNLNVIIGSRGSGKSTVVAAIRQLYSSTITLPNKVRVEAEEFSNSVLQKSRLVSTHRLHGSQAAQDAQWTSDHGQKTFFDDQESNTTFHVRVVNQKELYERVSKDNNDPFTASRSLLSFIDESIECVYSPEPPAGSWWRTYNDSREKWIESVRASHKFKIDLEQLPAIRRRVSELEKQLEAFDSVEAKARRLRMNSRQKESHELFEKESLIRDRLEKLRSDNTRVNKTGSLESDHSHEFELDLFKVNIKLSSISAHIRRRILEIVIEAENNLNEWKSNLTDSKWWDDVEKSKLDRKAYIAELAEKGIDPKTYKDLQIELQKTKSLHSNLVIKEKSSKDVFNSELALAGKVRQALEARRTLRTNLLDDISSRSGRLKFIVYKHHDWMEWTKRARELLGLRQDGFLEDLNELAKWLWEVDDNDEQKSRFASWKDALVSGDYKKLTERITLKQNWIKRLQSLDETIRLRLLCEFADDKVDMMFLKDGGKRDRLSDWQSITEGSPGQRTAAMLGFVLHHGSEPLVIDQPEDDLDTEWISNLVVKELRASRKDRQIIVVTHNANIPVNADAEHIIVMENSESIIRVRRTETSLPGQPSVEILHQGPLEIDSVRRDVQNIMEGGIDAFVRREKRYNNDVKPPAKR